MLADGREARGSALDTFRIESSMTFGGGSVQVRQYDWRGPTQDVWSVDSYFLHFCLTPRQGPASAEFLDGGPKAPVPLGRMMFVPPGRLVRSGGIQGRQRSLHCELSPELIDGRLERSPAWDEAALTEALRLQSPQVEWLVLRVYNELKNRDFGAETMVESLANALSVALIRQLGLGREGGRRREGGVAPWRMRRIEERVHADAPAPSLSELAGLCGMSVRHLCRAFKVETGQTIAKYVEQVLVERARALLADPNASVAEVAQTLGFSSSASFASAFRRATGIRPSDVGGRRRPSAAAPSAT